MRTALEGLKGLKAFFGSHDWCQGDFSKIDPDTGKMGWCLLGGLAASGVNYSPTLDALHTAMDGPKNHGAIAGWNDAPERTKQDVLDLIDRAIALEGAAV